MSMEPLLSVRDLSVDFSTYGRRSQVLRDVSLDVPAHRHVALVGESGCGKSVTMRTIMGILPTPPARIVGGQILFDGRDLLARLCAEPRCRWCFRTR
jgi:peptide/nickel transport system ATP-binding protein